MLSIAAYSGMFVFGIVMALLGAVLPALSERLHFAVADIGTLFLIMNFAMLVCSLVLGLGMDRFGMKPPLALGPLLVAAALVLIAYAQAFSDLFPAVALLCAAAGVYSANLRYPPPKQAHRLPVADMPRFLRSPLVLIFAALLFFESGVEFTLGGFISTYLTHDLAISSVSMASWILAGYWAAVILSRTLLSRIALGTDPFRILLFCSVGACLGALVAAAAPIAGVATFGIWMTGWSLAGIYPAVLGIAGTRFESHSGTVFGILFAIALTGGMIVPWLSGQVAALAGLRWVFALVSGCFAAIVLLGRLAHRRTGSTER